MPIRYKFDILTALKEKGYNTNRIRKERLFGESTLQAFRRSELVSWMNIERLCKFLDCQPGDILEYAEDQQAE